MVFEDWNVIVYVEGWNSTVIKDRNVVVIGGWIRVIIHGGFIILPKSAENCQWQQGIHRHLPRDFLF